MAPHHNRLTLDSLLSDPLTQLVMRSDGITTVEVAQAFEIARTGMSDQPPPVKSFSLCTTFDRWLGQGMTSWMG